MRFLSLPLLLSAALLAQGGATDSFSAKADAYVQSWARDGLFRGSVMVAKSGQPIFRKSYGMANSEWDIPNTPDTKFRLGSITKQFTAVAVLQLAEQGKLSLDDPVKKHYAGAPPAWDKITVHHLLTHTSGIPSYTDQPGFMQKQTRQPLSPAEIVKITQEQPLQFEPGSKMRYNNTGYVLLGHLIETLSGGSYAEYLRKNVFGPAGMNDSGYDTYEAVVKKRATGYSALGSRAQFIDMSLPHAAGALYSTVDDLLKWDRALYSGKLLKPESLQKMTTPFLDNYGYGLVIQTREGHQTIAHGGGIFGFNTQMLHFPDDGLMIAVLANQNTNGVDRIATDLSQLYFGRDIQPRPVRSEVKLPAARLDALAGSYEVRPGFLLKVWSQGDQLMTQAPNQPEVPAYATDDTHFFMKIFDGDLEFERDAEGKGVAVVLRMGSGKPTRAPRK